MGTFQGQSEEADYDKLALTISAVPEPGNWVMMLLGIGGLGAAVRSRRKAFAAA